LNLKDGSSRLFYEPVGRGKLTNRVIDCDDRLLYNKLVSSAGFQIKTGKDDLMKYLAENLRKFRAEKGLTQEDVAKYLHITPQSVSKWERGETYPDITFLPALANVFETSVDRLIGMDEIRAKEAVRDIHNRATTAMKEKKYDKAAKIYRDALKIYPNDPGMLLGLASVLALNGDTAESIDLIETGLPLSGNEKQKATMRAALCFLYAKAGEGEKAKDLAYHLPHTRESREVITPLLDVVKTEEEFDENIKHIILGEK